MANIYDETDLTPEERQWVKQAEFAGKYGDFGQAAGTALGAATGFIPVVGPAVAMAATPILGQVGKLIGQHFGGQEQDKANQQIALLQQKRNQEELDRSERLQALGQLTGQWTPYLNG